MQPQAIVDRARALGVTLRVEGNRILYSPKSQAPRELVETLREHMQELLVYLSHKSDRPVPCCTQNTKYPQKPGTEANPSECGVADRDRLLAWATELAEQEVVLPEPLTYLEASLRTITTERVSHYAAVYLRTISLAHFNKSVCGSGTLSQDWWQRQEQEATQALLALRGAMQSQARQEPHS